MEQYNEYIEKFNQFKEWVDSSNLSSWKKNRKNLFDIFSSLTEKDGHEMKLHLASGERGIGDVSYFFFEDSKGEVDREIEKYLSVSPTPMGAWELFLLKSATYIMPYFWHGGYERRYFVFSEEDLRKAGSRFGSDNTHLEIRDLSAIVDAYDLRPKVVEDVTVPPGDLKADIYCCLWNDWQGLVQEHCRISVTNGNIELKRLPSFVIYSYRCMVMF